MIHILVTRPDPAGSDLCARIKAQGDNAIFFPTIQFEPPQDTVAMMEAVKIAGDQDWLIFVSPHAVYASIPVLRREWSEFPDSVQFAAIGAGTARALLLAGYQVTAYPEQEWSSEGLLQMAAFQNMEGKRVMLIRGEDGRQLLVNTLANRGALVSHMVCYKRGLPNADIDELNRFVREATTDSKCIVASSGDCVQNLKILAGPNEWKKLQNIPLIVMSERIKVLAEDLGFQTIWVARNASNDAMLEVIAQKRDDLCRIKSKQ